MAQIKVKVGTTTSRKEVIVDSAASLKEVMDANAVSYSGDTSISLEGRTVTDLTKSFDDYGIKDSALLLAVVNTKNA